MASDPAYFAVGVSRPGCADCGGRRSPACVVTLFFLDATLLFIFCASFFALSCSLL